jgi:hypothetical protein
VWKTCGSAADRVWKSGRHPKIFHSFVPKNIEVLHRSADSCVVSLARMISLDQYFRGVENVRFEEIINGRNYVIEVSAVDPDRWRAEILRRGGHTALMPFYGATAIEAAAQLTQWLHRAAAAQ